MFAIRSSRGFVGFATGPRLTKAVTRGFATTLARKSTIPFEIRGTGDGVAQEVSVKNSSHKLTTDAYPAFGGKDAAPSPLHFNLTSLSSCTQVTGSLVAKDLGINLGKWDVEVAGHLDPSVLTQGVEGNANWKAISLKVRVDAEASKVDFEKFASETERRCPVTQLFKRSGVEWSSDWQNGS
ncbi:unnamed protein product [Zymoseptoria tritici ST99CH_3D1]|uniref:OsmC-like protein n=1 Tax=Zymoseptoria tritici (strain CBS 115943 / IPO323) TaxID=336722 RepID=F9XKJ2_ZYMTI|nr:uncharacterized protein MYCGRDRAFT_49178 [Zymoseptoria tritici IPO323]EGP84227.1 hypothetical protein MYCGRDRAFT_49178 [Zymoseptoria tritici IPO323]SMR62684.1 unnamed protein product [Zymoseptoria tritici ST99CH_3D1]